MEKIIEYVLLVFNVIKESFIPLLTTSYSIVNALGNLTITAIGIYTAYITFKHKIKFVGLTKHSGLWEGYYFSVTIQNQSLSAISIKKVEMILNDTNILLVKEFKEPLFLEAFKTVNITSNQTNNDLLGNIYNQNESMKLIVFCSSGKIIQTKFKKKKSKNFDETKYNRISEFTRKIDNITLNETMKYFAYLVEGNQVKRIIIISKSGFMSECIGEYNLLPYEIMNDKEEVTKTIQSLVNEKCTVQLVDVSLEIGQLAKQMKMNKNQ